MQVRCEKLKHRNPRDMEHQQVVETALQRYLVRVDELPKDWPIPHAVERYRWLVEEFRISLFAQSLGTSVPISGSRLDRYWEDLAL